ncbi:MAG: hypothetical protein CMM60_01845 [Rhodospirillaceae bacterium]|jgi:uncharacterized protein (DUF1330 family)|nr:hypothetical protein [Rhodospirillaceae bacterium]|tara:strand:+ start:866 stop:1159 length:294 start_codon:yes stop_codon:yes gene_type:complete
MAKAYWIAAHMDIKDMDKLMAYAERAGPVIEAHGGRFLARGGRVETMEGYEQQRVVVTEFPSLEEAVECYNSDVYQAAKAKLDGGVERDICIVEGLE